MVRKYTKIKTIYPSDDAVKKSVFLSIQEITKKWSMPVRDWGIIIGQLMIFFADRLDVRQAG
jgi:putative transposase